MNGAALLQRLRLIRNAKRGSVLERTHHVMNRESPQGVHAVFLKVMSICSPQNGLPRAQHEEELRGLGSPIDSENRKSEAVVALWRIRSRGPVRRLFNARGDFTRKIAAENPENSTYKVPRAAR